MLRTICAFAARYLAEYLGQSSLFRLRNALYRHLHRLFFPFLFTTDPLILVLDEVTSNLDGRTEAVVKEALRRLLKERTGIREKFFRNRLGA